MFSRKVWLVARREYLTNFRRPSFLFTAFGVPLLSLVAMFFVIQITASRETNLKGYDHVAYIDRAVGRGPVINPAADDDYDYQAVSNPAQPVPEAPDAAYYDALQEYANEQLRGGDLDMYFVLDENYVLTGNVELYSEKNVPAVLQSNIEDFLRNQIALSAEGIDLAVPAKRLGEPADILIRDVDSGDEISEAALIGRLLLPFLFVFIYFMSTTTTAQFLMSGVVEEKENRLMEILATSLRPLELLWGKIVGLGALALTQVAFWLVGGILTMLLKEDAREFITGAAFRPGDIALIVVLFIINFLLFAAIMMGIGAAVTAEAESRQIAGFLSFLALLPIMLSVTFFSNPNGPMPLFFSFFPLTAAAAIIMRIGLTTVPMWQIVLSFVIQVISVAGVVWLAAKVFRLGMLMYGKPLTPRTLWNALREGRVMLTTATTDGPVTPKKKKGWLRR
jgi:ABC-2 type transport system permease protein